MNPYREPSKPTNSRLREFFVDRRVSPGTVFLAAILLAGIGIAATPALRVNGVKFGPSDNTLYASAFGATGNGSTDDTTALQNWASAATAGTTLYLPAGNYKLTGTVTISTNNVHVVGAGTASTTVTFNPGSALPAFKFSAGASTIAGDSIEGISFVGGGTNQKIAVQLLDTDGFVARDIWVDSAFAGTWSGANSIGIQIKGRQLATIQRVRIQADTPIKISANPNSSTIGMDHFHFLDTYLKSTAGGGNSCIFIDDGVVVSNLTIDGENAWIVDKYGLFWSDTTAATAHINISLSGIRTEQAQDLTGYSISISSTIGIQNLRINDFYAATGQNGVSLTGVTNATISNSVFPTNNAAKLHLNIASTKDLFLENNYWQINTLATLTGMTLMWASPQVQSSAVLPPTAWYSDSTTATNQSQTITPVITAKSNVFTNTSMANTNPIHLDTTNTFSGGSEMVGFYNATTRKAYVDSGGSFESVSGIFDIAQAGAMFVGNSHATNVNIASTTAQTNIKGGLILHRTTVADTTYTALIGDTIIAYTSLTAGRVLTVPGAAPVGTVYIVKNESTGAFAITITPSSGTCDGAASCATTAAAHAAAVRIYSDGTNYNTF